MTCCPFCAVPPDRPVERGSRAWTCLCGRLHFLLFETGTHMTLDIPEGLVFHTLARHSGALEASCLVLRSPADDRTVRILSSHESRDRVSDVPVVLVTDQEVVDEAMRLVLAHQVLGS